MEELTAQGFPCRRDLCQGADARLRAMTPDPAAGLRDLHKRVIEDKWSPTEEVLKRYIAGFILLAAQMRDLWEPRAALVPDDDPMKTCLLYTSDAADE